MTKFGDFHSEKLSYKAPFGIRANFPPKIVKTYSVPEEVIKKIAWE